MHLVIAERVFPRIRQLNVTPPAYGPFLLGCVLVDVHAFSHIERSATHFSERLVKNGGNGFNRSCANFLDQLDTLLACPWDALTNAERAFIAGYLCHLAADEDWKQFDWTTLHTGGIYLWTDLPVPGDVLLTVFDVLSNELYVDFPSVSTALRSASVPDVLAHIPHETLQTMWDVTKEHLVNNSSLESYLAMLRRLKKTNEQVQAARFAHELHWEEAVELIQEHFGGVRSRMQSMVQRSLETMPLLYE
jgi:hypothetical protein